MVKIRHLSLDGFSLELEYQDSKLKYNERIYYIERDKSNTETISTRNVALVDVFGTIVSPQTIKQFAQQNNGYSIVDGFIFPSLNLIMSISQDQKEFSEVLIYSSILRGFYETNCVPETTHNFETIVEVRVVPYNSIGDFTLGDSAYSVQKQLGLPIETYPLKSIMRSDKFFLSFYNGKLGQVNLILDQDTKLKIGDTLVTIKDSIKFLSEVEEVIYRSSHYVFPNLGIALHRDLNEITGFDENILKYWQNIHRPISSW